MFVLGVWTSQRLSPLKQVIRIDQEVPNYFPAVLSLSFPRLDQRLGVVRFGIEHKSVKSYQWQRSNLVALQPRLDLRGAPGPTPGARA